MALTLMYITNNPITAKIAQEAGVDRIWVDMEYIGKDKRQGKLDTVKNHHTVEDVKKLRPEVTSAELMVRVNPIHEATAAYADSKSEIDEVLEAGADVIMLPMFSGAAEVERFVSCVDGRAKVQLLVETAQAVENIDDILAVPGVDEIHVGLNDLHLAYHMDFMFELLCGDTIRELCEKFQKKGIKYGFGGVARVGYGMLPAELILAEHYHLGSTAAILSRGFCDANIVKDPMEIKSIFIEGVKNIRRKEQEVARFSQEQYQENLRQIRERVATVVETQRQKK